MNTFVAYTSNPLKGQGCRVLISVHLYLVCCSFVVLVQLQKLHATTCAIKISDRAVSNEMEGVVALNDFKQLVRPLR